MAWLEVKVELGRVVEQLTRIADILERYCFPKRYEVTSNRKPAGPEALIEFDPEKEWLREREEEARKGTDTLP